MSLVNFYPVSDLNTFYRQMNRFLDELSGLESRTDEITIKPAIELRDDGDNLTLRVMLPGFKASELDINVTRDAVTISGERRLNDEHKDKGYYVSEFRYGKLARTIDLPIHIQNDKVVADYKDGILTLTLPKVEEVKNKVVKVNLESVE